MALYLGGNGYKLYIGGIPYRINIFSAGASLVSRGLLSYDNYVLQDSNGVSLIAQDGE